MYDPVIDSSYFVSSIGSGEKVRGRRRAQSWRNGGREKCFGFTRSWIRFDYEITVQSKIRENQVNEEIRTRRTLFRCIPFDFFTKSSITFSQINLQ